MKYVSLLPLSALAVLCLLSLLISAGVIPDGFRMLELLNEQFASYFFLMIFIIILLESIVYVGFYFPGQFFAVMLVVLSGPGKGDMLLLTVCMVIAATIGSAINYLLGRKLASPDTREQKTRLRHMLLAMVHMNSLAFYMFNLGARGGRFSLVLLAGLLNLPYYLLIVYVTVTLSDEITQVAENNTFLFCNGMYLVSDFFIYRLATAQES